MGSVTCVTRISVVMGSVTSRINCPEVANLITRLNANKRRRRGSDHGGHHCLSRSAPEWLPASERSAGCRSRAGAESSSSSRSRTAGKSSSLTSRRGYNLVTRDGFSSARSVVQLDERRLRSAVTRDPERPRPSGGEPERASDADDELRALGATTC